MGMTRDLFKKMRDTNGTFHVKMGTIKNSLIFSKYKKGGNIKLKS